MDYLSLLSDGKEKKYMDAEREKEREKEKKSTLVHCPNTLLFSCVLFLFWFLFFNFFFLTLYRRDSFITHRAFCDALAEESARAITTNNPLLTSHQQQQLSGSSTTSHINLQPQFNMSLQQHNQDHHLHGFTLKKEQPTSFSSLRPEMPPWLACNPGPPPHLDISSSSSIFSTRLDPHQDFTQTHDHHQDLSNHIHDQAPHHHHHHHHPNPNPSLGPTLPAYQPTPSPHMSATALLQKAAQMGATMSSKTSTSTTTVRPHQQAHVSAAGADHHHESGGDFGLNLSSREEMATTGFAHGLAAFGNKAALLSSAVSATTSTTATTTTITSTTPGGSGGGAGTGTVPPSSFLHDMMNSLSSGTGFEGTSFEDAFGGILNNNNSKKDKTRMSTSEINETGGGGGNGGHESLTRDFLGLRALSHSDILNIAGLGNCLNTTPRDHQNQPQKPWQG